ncbi:MAG TPA: MBOAT family protein, partial [Alphaproteobacteria bacterium]
MLFNSFLFLALFLPAVFVGFLIFSKLNRRLAVMWLGAASLVFYMLGSPMEHTLLLLGSIAANWFFGRAIVSAQQGKKFWLTIAIIFNLSLLGWFKYSLFIAGILGASDWPAIVLPLGISFYTFTQIAYLVDEYRKPRPYHPTDYFLFVIYFPHLIAGPILNHAQTIPQFEDKNT